MALFKVYRGLASNLPSALHDGYAYFTTDDGKFYIDADNDGTVTRTLVNPDAAGIRIATTSEWAAQTSLVSEEGIIYVYSDHQTKDGTNIPGLKIGDGKAYVVDLPFIDTLYIDHIADTDIHITATERTKWNKAITATMSSSDAENVLLSYVS